MGGVQSYFASEHYIALNANDLSETVLKYYINLASDSLGTTIIEVSDEFYSAAKNLLLDQETLKLTDDEEDEERDGYHEGWQTKRHLDSASVTVRLGCHGRIYGIDIDTTGFINGAPATATVEGAQYHAKGTDKWDTLLDHVAIKPNAHNFFLLHSTDHVYSQAKLTVSPGGGVARFRCYGDVVAMWPKHLYQHVNLASVHNGAHIVSWTDTKQSNNPNILLDGGKDAESGWETPRSRTSPRNDFVVIQLGSPGILNSIVIDTAHFVGNAPQAVSVDGCYSREENPEYDYGATWTEILREEAVNPDSENTFTISTDETFSHLRLTIHPDGGIQQFSAYGLPYLEDGPIFITEPTNGHDLRSTSKTSSTKDSEDSSSTSNTSPNKSKRQRVAAEKAVEVIKEVVSTTQRKKRRT